MFHVEHHSHMDTEHADPSTVTLSDIPDWLSPIVDPVEQRKTVRELMHQKFKIIFEDTLEKITAGWTLKNITKEAQFDPLVAGKYNRWIHADPERKRLYEEAKEYRTEAWAGEIIKHAYGDEILEDVPRSKLVIDSLKWLMMIDHRKRYGDTKTIEFGGQISITAALDQARGRMGQTIEGEVINRLPELTTDRDDPDNFSEDDGDD